MRPKDARLLALYDCRVVRAHIKHPIFCQLSIDGYAYWSFQKWTDRLRSQDMVFWKPTIAGDKRAKEITDVRTVGR